VHYITLAASLDKYQTMSYWVIFLGNFVLGSKGLIKSE